MRYRNFIGRALAVSVAVPILSGTAVAALPRAATLLLLPVNALLWPSFPVYALVRGYNNDAWSVAKAISISAVFNIAIYAILASLIWWGLKTSRGVILFISLAFIVTYMFLILTFFGAGAF